MLDKFNMAVFISFDLLSLKVTLSLQFPTKGFLPLFHSCRFFDFQWQPCLLSPPLTGSSPVLPLLYALLPGPSRVCFSSLLMHPTALHIPAVRTASSSPMSATSSVFTHTVPFLQISLLHAFPCSPHQFCLLGSGQVVASFRELAVTSLRVVLHILWVPFLPLTFIGDNAHHIHIDVIKCLR